MKNGLFVVQIMTKGTIKYQKPITMRKTNQFCVPIDTIKRYPVTIRMIG